MSVITKISYLEYRNSFFSKHFKRTIPLIIVCEDEERLFHNLKLYDLINVDNVYFTTLKRLETLKFNEALFRITTDGNIFHYEDNGLTKRVYEKKI